MLIFYGIVLHLCLLLLRCQSNILGSGGWNPLCKIAPYETNVTIYIGCFRQRFSSSSYRDRLQILP